MIFDADYIREKFFKSRIYRIRFEYYGNSLVRNLARISYSSLAHELQSRKDIWCEAVRRNMFGLNPCYLRKCSRSYRKKLFEKYFAQLDRSRISGEIRNILDEYNLHYIVNIHAYNKVMDLVGDAKNLLINNNMHDIHRWLQSLKEI